MKRMKLKRFLVSIILIIVTLTSFNGISLSNNQIIDSTESEYENTYIIMGEKITMQKSKDEVFDELVDEVNKYIRRQSPQSYKGLSEHLVAKCLDNDLDICFAMCQTQVETNFGTTGAGRSSSRRSLFGVAGKSYNSYESAINDYVNIIKTKYLVRGKTEQSLLNNYVNRNGKRYAESTSYEVKLKSAYSFIKHSTKIYKLQKHYLEML